MSTESQAVDHYAAVLADLRAKRDQIDQAIQVIEALRGGAPAPTAQKASAPIGAGDDVDGPGAFLGMTIADAAKKLLASRRRTMSNAEITAAFKQGGLALTSADPINTVGSVLTRRFNQVGDIVKMGRGVWGLSEWYPGRNFRKKPKDEADADDVADAVTHAIASELESNVRAGRPPATDEPDPWSPIDGRS